MSDNSRVRVSIVGVVIVALFASLFARLWFLQMGPEQRLGNVVSTLATRVIQTESPRGEILDRNGKVLAQDVASWAVTVDRNMKKKTLQRVMGQLSEVLGVDEQKLLANYNSNRQSPLTPAVVWLNVPLDKQLAIREHSEDYPGVSVIELTVRKYPYDGLASQLLGYVGEINADQLKQLKSKGYQAGDLIGRDGIEAAYENVLRGRPRRVTVQIDPSGKQVGPPISVDPGTVGDNVKLTIDINVQRAAEKALAQGIVTARQEQDETAAPLGYSKLKATGGSVVVLNTHDGSIAAMASYPTYPLSWWVGGISTAHFDSINNAGSGDPLLNRATEGQYAPGSTFKLVPAIALNQYGIQGATQIVHDNGQVTLEGTTFHNDNGAINGDVDLTKALTVSSDVYFYQAGDAFWQKWNQNQEPQGLGIQTIAGELGFGKPTGVEIDEATGRVPSPDWNLAFANANFKKGSQAWKDSSAWRPGNNILAAVGQGDDFVTPLQLANAYATFANGGTLWTPHVGETVTDPTTKKVIKLTLPQSRGKITIDGFVYSEIAAGFAGVVSNPSGTAYSAFQGLNLPVSGKTGTAQIATAPGAPTIAPTSLFAAYFPAENTQYAAVAVVEQAGHGADIAAPIIRQVIESMNHLPVTPIPLKTNGSGKD